MKKLFTIIASVFIAMTIHAQTDVVVGTISNDANLADQNTSESWAFIGGYAISNAKSKNYSAASNCVKFSRKLDFNIVVPADVKVSAVEFEGYTNGPSADGSYSYVSKLNGVEYDAQNDDKTTDFIKNHQAKYGFSGNDELADDGSVKTTIHKIPVEGHVAGTPIPFYIGGTSQIAAIIRIYAVSASTGVEKVYNYDTTTQTMYDLNGRKASTPHQGQVYIQNGKKFVKK